MSEHFLIQKIDAVLPQTQCTKCGYDGCLPYATAIATEQAPINRCPPGGDLGIQQLAEVTGQAIIPLDTSCGEAQELQVAVIDEEHCIGCTLCIRACPVDAIIGANKFMHTVIPDLCSGCDLCIPVCPVDCIQMVPANRAWTRIDADEARSRHQHRARRLVIQAELEEERLNQHSSRPSNILESADEVAEQLHADNKQSGILEENKAASQAKSAAIAMALARARARRQSS